MKWLLKDPSLGDMVRVKIGNIYHYGIFVSEDEVIQFGPAPNEQLNLRPEDIEVIATDIDNFLVGGFLEVADFDKKEKKKNRKPEDVAKYAQANIGRKGYSIIYNNCEHFANECVSGYASSSQTDGLRSLFRSIPIVDVFTARIPDDCKIGAVFPIERNDEINAVTNESARREKYCSWQLLKYALDRSLGLKIENISLSKDENGKWSTPSCYFSISHSHSLLAIAVSRAPVGIDIEALSAPLMPGFDEKVLTEKEKLEYASLTKENKDEYLISKWTAKEAFFKRDGKAAFIPREINIVDNELCVKSIELDSVKYFCSIATKTPEKIRFFEDIPTARFLK